MESHKQEDDSILFRHGRIMAQILKHFNAMVMAATQPLPESAVLERASLNRLTMETETAALIREIQSLLALNREIKALWIQGPLNKPGEDKARQAELDRRSEVVLDLFDKARKMFLDQEVQRVRDEAEKRARSGEVYDSSSEGKGKEGDDENEFQM